MNFTILVNVQWMTAGGNAPIQAPVKPHLPFFQQPHKPPLQAQLQQEVWTNSSYTILLILHDTQCSFLAYRISMCYLPDIDPRDSLVIITSCSVQAHYMD